MKTLQKVPLSYRIAFIISLLCFGAASITCYYTDLRSLTVWTTNFWDTLYYTGNFRNYYSFSSQNLYFLDHAMVGSDILIYIPWAIWNLPIWILQRFHNMTILEHPLMLFYSKCFLILMLLLTAIALYRVLRRLSDVPESNLQNIILFASSFFVLTGIAYIGQNDILVIFFFLLALECFLSEKIKTFLLFAAISIAMKPFFIFSFIALILLKEKKIHKIILYIIAGMSIYFLQKIPFYHAPMYNESLSYGPTGNIIGLLLEASLPFTRVGVSIFVLSLLLVYLLAYFDTNRNRSNQRCIYYCTMPFICFFAFTNFESYRPIYLLVLLVLLFAAKPAYKRINLILEMLFTGALIVHYMLTDSLFYNPLYIHLPSRHPDYYSIYSFMQTNLPNIGIKAFMAVATFALLCMAVINHPEFKSENHILCLKEEKYLIILRSLLYAFPFALAVLLKCVL